MNLLLIPAAAWIGLRIRTGTFYEIGPVEDGVVFVLFLLGFLGAATAVSMGLIGTWRTERRIAIGGPAFSVLISAASAGSFLLAAGSAEPLRHLWRIPAYAAVPYVLVGGILFGLKWRAERR